MTHRAIRTALAFVAGVSLLQCAAGPATEGKANRSRGGKLASVLYELATAADRRGYAESRRIPLSEGRVTVVVHLASSATDIDRERLVEKFGVIVEKSANRLLCARVPIDALIDLSGDAAVSFVDLPDRPGI